MKIFSIDNYLERKLEVFPNIIRTELVDNHIIGYDNNNNEIYKKNTTSSDEWFQITDENMFTHQFLLNGRCEPEHFMYDSSNNLMLQENEMTYVSYEYDKDNNLIYSVDFEGYECYYNGKENI